MRMKDKCPAFTEGFSDKADSELNSLFGWWGKVLGTSPLISPNKINGQNTNKINGQNANKMNGQLVNPNCAAPLIPLLMHYPPPSMSGICRKEMIELIQCWFLHALAYIEETGAGGLINIAGEMLKIGKSGTFLLAAPQPDVWTTIRGCHRI